MVDEDPMVTNVVDTVPSEVILGVKHGAETVSDITRGNGRTYSHVTRVTERLVDHGYLEREKSGRKKVLSLTDDGEQVAEALEELSDAVKRRR